MTEKHYVYGGGTPGCLYDYGPNFTDSKQTAIADLVYMYLDCQDEPTGSEWTWEHEEALLRENLENHGIHYFTSTLRHAVGADYCEVNEQSGPCPESDE